MSLREEAQKIFAENVAKDPVWAAMASDDRLSADISGPVEETIQAVTNTLMAATTGLVEVALHLADAVDDLRRKLGADADGD